MASADQTITNIGQVFAGPRYPSGHNKAVPRPRRRPVPMRDLWAVVPESESARTLSLNTGLRILGWHHDSRRVYGLRSAVEEATGRKVRGDRSLVSFAELLAAVDCECRKATTDRRKVVRTLSHGLVLTRLHTFRRMIEARREVERVASSVPSSW